MPRPRRRGRPARRRRRRASRRDGRPAGWCRRGWPRPAGRCASGRAAGSPMPPPTARCRSTSPRPCSTCSSTKRADPAQRLVVAAERSRVAAGRAPSPRPVGTPSASVSARARSAASAPVMIREPAQATPKRAPSSSPKLTTPIGRAGVESACRAAHPGRRRPRRRRAGRRRRRRRAPSPGASRPRRPGVCVGVAEPGPLVAGAVERQAEPARGRLAGEPVPQRRVLGASTRSGGSRRCAGCRPIGSRSDHSDVEARRHPPACSSRSRGLGHRDRGPRARPRPPRPGRSRRPRAGSRPCPGRWSAPARSSARPARCRRPRRPGRRGSSGPCRRRRRGGSTPRSRRWRR